jgi:flavin-binding protein dodecin
MSDTIYKVIELIGTSEVSWEDAAKKVVAYRARVSLSFKYNHEK